MMPLQVLYVDDKRSAKEGVASFSFGSGTLKGHLLAGEERFSITMDENKKVWYEIVSFSKPDHFLSLVGYPYVFLSQKFFGHQQWLENICLLNSIVNLKKDLKFLVDKVALVSFLY